MIRFWTQKLPSSSLIESASESEDDDSDDERALPDILKQSQFIWWRRGLYIMVYYYLSSIRKIFIFLNRVLKIFSSVTIDHMISVSLGWKVKIDLNLVCNPHQS